MTDFVQFNYSIYNDLFTTINNSSYTYSTDIKNEFEISAFYILKTSIV